MWVLHDKTIEWKAGQFAQMEAQNVGICVVQFAKLFRGNAKVVDC